MPVSGLQTLEPASAISNQPKRIRLGTAISLQVEGAKGPTSIFSANDTEKYLHGLKIILWSMAKAGTFTVVREGKDTFFAPLGPLLQHLADAEQYAMEHSLKKFDHAEVFKMLVKINEAIRLNWCKQLRASGDKTLGAIIKSQEAFATSLWLSDPQAERTLTDVLGGKTRKKGKQGLKGEGKSGKGKFEWTPPWMRSQTEQLGYPSNMPLALTDYEPNTKGTGKKATAVRKGGRQICKRFNDNRGCRDPNCRDDHVCDVIVNGQPFGERHPRSEHSGQYQRR